MKQKITPVKNEDQAKIRERFRRILAEGNSEFSKAYKRAVLKEETLDEKTKKKTIKKTS